MDDGMRPDWPELILDLKRHGWDAAKVALALNVTKATVGWWLNHNGEPGWTLGNALIKLHSHIKHRRASDVWFAISLPKVKDTLPVQENVRVSSS